MPSGLRRDIYNQGLSCDGFSRLISSELGGPENARIIRVDRVERGDRAQDAVSHTYVIPPNAKPDDLAYNSIQENPTIYGGDELNAVVSSFFRGNPALLAREGRHNNWWGDRKTVREVLAEGKDVTDEIFSTSWDRL